MYLRQTIVTHMEITPSLKNINQDNLFDCTLRQKYTIAKLIQYTLLQSDLIGRFKQAL